MSKKSFLDSIKSPLPCSKNWAEMTGDAQKRFCGSCEKDVHNISAMTRKEARKFAAQNSGKACVRFERLENGKVLTADTKFHKIGRASRIAAGVFSAALTISAVANAQTTEITKTPQKPTTQNQTQPVSQESTIFFTVYDISGTPIKDARVTLTNLTTKQQFVSEVDEKGTAVFAEIPLGFYEVEANCLHCNSFKQTIQINQEPETNRKITLEANVEIVGVFTLDKPRKKKIDKKTSRISFTIYDPSGEVIPNAEVKLTNIKTSKEFISYADANGIANFALIPHGRYEIETSANGFRSYKQTIQIKQKIEPNTKVTLEVGTFTGIVSVDTYEIPFFTIIAQENKEEIRRMISQGFDVKTKDSSKKTALHIALEHSNLEAVKILLDANANVNAKDKYNRTPLLMIDENIEENTVEIVRLLIQKGADVNAQDKEKRTALMFACDDDNLEIVKMLLEAGANPNLKDEDGETALDKTDEEEIKQLLKQYGAKNGTPSN